MRERSKDRAEKPPPRLGGRTLARNTLFNVVGQGVPLLIGVVSLPVLVDGLGAERFGLLALAWIVFQSSSLFDLGLGRAVTKFVADALARGNERAVPGLVWTATGAQLVLGIVGGAVLVALAPTVVERLLVLPDGLAAEARAALQLVAIALPIVLVSTSLTGALQAAQRFDLINGVRAPLNAANYLLPIAGLSLGLALPGIVVLLIASRIVSLGAFAFLSVRALPGLRHARRARMETLRTLLGFGGWIMASSATIPVLAHVERVLIASLLSVGALTFYTVPYEVLSRLAVLPASFALTIFPAVSYYQARAPDQMPDILGRSLKFLLVAVTPAVLFLSLFARDVLSLWLGEEFAAEAASALRILAIAFFLNAFAQIALATLQGLGRPDLKVKLDLIEVPIFVALCWIAIPAWGIAGAAFAKLMISIVDVSALFLLVRWVGGSAPGWLASRFSRRALAASVVFAAVAIILVGGTGPPLAEVVIFLSALCLYLVAFWYLGTDARDRSALHWRSLLRRGEGVGA